MEKNSKRSDRKAPSSVVKTGGIALAFLIIGYQSALFVQRAVVLKIAAARDVPDTVYITPVDTIRHNAVHSAPVEQVRRTARRKVENFRFNPNTVSFEDLQRLGFSEKQAQSILNYRAKGGRFRRPSDFAASFVVSDSVYRRLEPYISIPKLDINKADSAAFDGLPGIGPYFSAKMVQYRQRLGGYSFKEQLMDIYHFDKEKYDGLSDLIVCSRPSKAFRLWTLPEDSLRLHPYIKSWQAAHSIVLFRENTPREEWTVQGLAKAGILPDEDASRLARCCIAEP